MKKIWQLLSVAIVGLAMLFPATAQAQDSYFGVRIEPGLAIPAGSPQDDRFSAGFALAVKPEFSIVDVFSFGPSASMAVFSSDVEGVESPAIWALGGFVRLKRPHGFEWNDSVGAATVSPWIDADVQYVRTGPLNRVGYAVAAGAAWPVEESRMLWIGPYVRYQGVHQDDDLVGRNTNDSHNIIVGASFEIGEAMQRTPYVPVDEEPVVPGKPEPQPQPEPAKPEPKFENVNIELHQVVQFAWDSSKLDAFAIKQLDEVVQRIMEAKEYKAIKIEGHASSEGQVPHNNKLAQRRADAVLNYLASKGIARDKLSAAGFGSTVPVASNASEPGRVLNRRAEFVVNFVIVKEVK